LAKLKINLQINFQTFNKIIINLKNNTSYLTQTIAQFDLNEYRFTKFPTFTNKILFLKILIKNLKALQLENNIMMILMQICENLSDLEDPNLNFETFELMLLISEQINHLSPKIFVLFSRMVLDENRIDKILFLCQKWYKKKKFVQTLNTLWRTQFEILINIVKHGHSGNLKDLYNIKENNNMFNHSKNKILFRKVAAIDIGYTLFRSREIILHKYYFSLFHNIFGIILYLFKL
jgi:hypothetical protein